jgi:hypothetical protein
MKAVGLADAKSPYLMKTLGIADDLAEASDTDVLSYKQAFKAATTFAETCKGHDKSAEKFTVADAVAFYLENHSKREGRALARTVGLYNSRILPEPGKKTVASLKKETLNRWMQGLATSARQLRGGTTAAIDKTDPDAVRARKASANRILNQLKAALNFAYQAGKVPSDDAWRRVKPFKRADAPKIRYLSADECRRLVNPARRSFVHWYGRPWRRAAATVN